jgi:pyruvate dehydrogenase E2 component (dihydrolipoamide acetyltransferase)
VTDERIQRVTMPKWGLSMHIGKVVDWFVSEGDTVAKGDDLVDIETEKIADNVLVFGTVQPPQGRGAAGVGARGGAGAAGRPPASAPRARCASSRACWSPAPCWRRVGAR